MKSLSRLLAGYLLFSCAFAIELASAQSLSNGESLVTSGSMSSRQYFIVEIPAQAKNLLVTTNGGSGDADLYVRYGSTPKLSAYDCRPYIAGNSESCSFASTPEGTYSIMLVGYESFSGVELRVSYELESSTVTDDVIDIVTYNVEWLGNPSISGYDGSREQQIDAAAEDIISGGGEIYALQEVGGSSALDDLLFSLNSMDLRSDWSGDISQRNARQSLAFVYKGSIVSNASFETILTDENDYNFAGRYPFLMRADINFGSSQKPLNLVNVHLKCCTDSTSAGRRAAAMQIVLEQLNSFYRTDNLVLLGDMNVAQEGGANGEISDWGTFRDTDDDGLSDFSHAAGSIIDKPYVSSETESDIDHILISNELKSSWNAVPPSLRNTYLTTTMSDHSPVKTSLNISLIGESVTDGPGSGGSGIAEAISANLGDDIVITGKISAEFNGIYALVLSDPLDSSKTIIVKLSATQRDIWSPRLNPGVIGTSVSVIGKRDLYSGLPSIEYVSEINPL